MRQSHSHVIGWDGVIMAKRTALRHRANPPQLHANAHGSGGTSWAWLESQAELEQDSPPKDRHAALCPREMKSRPEARPWSDEECGWKNGIETSCFKKVGLHDYNLIA
jgi:hypothetical protein